MNRFVLLLSVVCHVFVLLFSLRWRLRPPHNLPSWECASVTEDLFLFVFGVWVHGARDHPHTAQECHTSAALFTVVCCLLLLLLCICCFLWLTTLQLHDYNCTRIPTICLYVVYFGKRNVSVSNRHLVSTAQTNSQVDTTSYICIRISKWKSVRWPGSQSQNDTMSDESESKVETMWWTGNRSPKLKWYNESDPKSQSQNDTDKHGKPGAASTSIPTMDITPQTQMTPPFLGPWTPPGWVTVKMSRKANTQGVRKHDVVNDGVPPARVTNGHSLFVRCIRSDAGRNESGVG